MMSKRNLIGSLILTVVFIAIIYYFSFTFSQALGGFDDPIARQQFNIYTSIGGLALLGIGAMVFIEFIIKKGDSQYGDGIGYFSLGEQPHLEFFENYSAVQLTLLSLIIFLALALGNILLVSQTSLLQESYTGIGFVEQQQFSPGENALYAVALIPASETLAILFVISLIIVTLRAIARRYDLGQFNFFILTVFSVMIICFITGFLWHIRVYPESDAIRFTGSMFWAVKGLLITLTGFAVVGWILHIVNNAMFKLVDLFSADSVIVFFSFVIFLLIAGYIFLYRDKSLTGINS